VLLIGILFGLAMDYEVFLVSRMREAYVKSGDAREAIITGYGKRAWAMPKRLERVVPDVDIEGEQLAHTVRPAAAARG
jgi:uncharacterized membrane protein YdfJ with MMPL/SSD domain